MFFIIFLFMFNVYIQPYGYDRFSTFLSFTFIILPGRNDPYLITISALPRPLHYIVRIRPLGMFALLLLSLIFRGYPLSSNSSPSVYALLPLYFPLHSSLSPPYFRSHQIFQKRLYRLLVCQQIGDRSFFGSALPSYANCFELFFKNSSLSPTFPTFGVEVKYRLFRLLAPPTFCCFGYLYSF